MNYQGIVFDFNGTMFFDTVFQERSWREYVKKLIGRDVTDEEFKTYIHGRNAIDTFEYFLGRSVSPEESARLEEEKEKIYRKLCLENRERFVLAPGLPDFLDYLKEKGIPMTIATASGRNNVDFFFDHLDLGKWFDREIVIYNDGHIAGKPDPEIYTLACQELGIPPETVLVFEDSPSGIESARRAGVETIICINQLLTESNAADYTIADYTELKDFEH